jgi:GT2 family glycosyltransferase
LAGALNRGVAEARRPWIARMDADDIARPDRFEKQLAAAAANPAVLVWGSFACHMNSKGQLLSVSRTGPTTPAEFEALKETGEDIFVLHPTWLAKRSAILDAGGYDPFFSSCEDFELLDRVSERGLILAIPEPLLNYRIHSTSSTARRFFHMRRRADYVVARRHARRAGRVLTFEQHEAERLSKSPAARTGEFLRISSSFHYRQAGLHYGERRLAPACGHFAVATAMSPRYALRRVWSQMFSSVARKMKGAVESVDSASIRVAGTQPG